jgi:hypothetical protein
MSTFVDAVNRVLRLEGIIRGDDTQITDFTSTQHSASIEFAKIAIQDELSWLSVQDGVELPYERTTGTVTLTADTRTYAMPTDFLRFQDEDVKMYPLDSSSNVQSDWIYELNESEVRRRMPDYESQAGTPQLFYFIGATTTQVGFYPVPSSSGKVYKFWYEKSTDVTTSTDTIPLIRTNEYNLFTEAAARKFKFIRLGPQERDVLYPSGVERDPILDAKRANLIRVLRNTKPSRRYGRAYA